MQFSPSYLEAREREREERRQQEILHAKQARERELRASQEKAVAHARAQQQLGTLFLVLYFMF